MALPALTAGGLLASRSLYLAVFGAAAVLNFLSLTRIGAVTDKDTRRGLGALLLLSGLWAAGHVGFLAAPTPELSIGFYTFGLIVGLATVGAWLYVASAYTGRSYHRDPRYRRAAVGVFLAIVAVKVTNPLHGLYFTTEFVTVPFEHTTIHNQPLHWLVMGISYALAAIAYFMLYERFARVSYDTRPLAALIGVTALPILLDVVGYASPVLIDITYEPLGVAVFAPGVVFVFLERFQSVRVAGEHEDPVLVLDDKGRITEYNTSAGTLFPDRLGPEARGEPLWTVIPDLPDFESGDTPIYEAAVGEGTRYYNISTSPFTSGETPLGEMVLFSDVTNRERYRRELERQNERLDQFASMVSHDLRNPLNVAQGHLEMAKDGDDTNGDLDTATDGDDNNGHLDTATDALDRMDEMIEDVLDLARQGQPVSDPEPVSLRSVAEAAWKMVDSREATLDIEGDLAFEADPDRLQRLFENLLRNAIDHAGTESKITVGPLEDGRGFYVADDGPGIPETNRDDVFESGFTTRQSGTGFGLAIVAEIVDAHGWSIAVGEDETGGARFEITGVES